MLHVAFLHINYALLPFLPTLRPFSYFHPLDHFLIYFRFLNAMSSFYSINNIPGYGLPLLTSMPFVWYVWVIHAVERTLIGLGRPEVWQGGVTGERAWFGMVFVRGAEYVSNQRGLLERMLVDCLWIVTSHQAD